MTFSLTITANTISDLHEIVAKLSSPVSEKSIISPIEKNEVVKSKVGRPAAVKTEPVVKPVSEEEKLPTFLNKDKKETLPVTTFTYSDVKKATVALASKNSEKVREILGEFGVTTATALKETQWEEYVDKLKDALELLSDDYA